MRDVQEMVALAEKGVKLALTRGASAAEAYVASTRNTQFSAAGRYISPSESAGFAVGIRVIVEGRVGLSGASSEAGLARAATEAVQSVRATASEAGALTDFPHPRADAMPRVMPDARLLADRTEPLAAFAEAAMEEALSRRDVSYAAVNVASSSRRIAIANSSGLVATEETAIERLEVETRVTRATTSRSGHDAIDVRAPLETQVDPAAFAEDLGARVASAMDASPLAGAVNDAILYSAPASQILGMLAASFTPRGGPASRLGQDAYSPLVTIRDEPRGPSGARWRNIDDEGVPTRGATLVERGRLAAILHDTRTAKRDGVEPTGSGYRASAAAHVAPRPQNVVLEPGDHSLDELIESAERAVIVPDALIGGFTFNQTTADFSVVVPYAFLVENGRVKHPLPPLTVGGNAHRVLKEVQALGRERRTFAPATAVPLRTRGVSCAT